MRPPRNAKIGIRTSNPTPVKSLGRVAQKGAPGKIRTGLGKRVFKGKLNYAPW